MHPRLRRWLQRAAFRFEAAARDLQTIHHTDVMAGRYAAFGPGSVIHAPQLFLGNTASIAIGAEVLIRSWCAFEALAPPGTAIIRIGDKCQLGHGVRLVAVNGIELGEGVGIGHGTTLADSIHDYKSVAEGAPPWQSGLKLGAPMRIEPNVWVGNNCVVTGGITIGEGAIIGPNTVVNRDVPPGTLVVGNPARVQRRRRDDGSWEWLVPPESVDLMPPTLGDPGEAAVPPASEQG